MHFRWYQRRKSTGYPLPQLQISKGVRPILKGKKYKLALEGKESVGVGHCLNKPFLHSIAKEGMKNGCKEN